MKGRIITIKKKHTNKLGIKKLYFKNVVEFIEEYQKYNNNTRKLYQTINQFKKGYQLKFNMIRNKKENWQSILKKE